MKILFLGDARDAGIILQALESTDNDEITYCASGPDAIAELLTNKYDWAIAEGSLLVERKKDIIKYFQKIGRINHDDQTVKEPIKTDLAHSTKSTKCGVEWSKNGVLQLHCGLHEFIKHRPPSDPFMLNDAGAILFEYHAPCIKVRGRDG